MSLGVHVSEGGGQPGARRRGRFIWVRLWACMCRGGGNRERGNVVDTGEAEGAGRVGSSDSLQGGAVGAEHLLPRGHGEGQRHLFHHQCHPRSGQPPPRARPRMLHRPVFPASKMRQNVIKRAGARGKVGQRWVKIVPLSRETYRYSRTAAALPFAPGFCRDFAPQQQA